MLVIHSLFSDSAEISKKEYIDIKNNLTNIAHKGRDKNNKIIKKKTVIIENELSKILNEMEDIAKIMSSVKNDDNYEICVKKQKKENLR